MTLLSQVVNERESESSRETRVDEMTPVLSAGGLAYREQRAAAVCAGIWVLRTHSQRAVRTDRHWPSTTRGFSTMPVRVLLLRLVRL